MHTTRPFLLLAGLLLPATAAAQMTTAQKIEDATSAAPPSISADAAVMDWPASPDAGFTTLREGTNRWTCLPDMPMTGTHDPMCLDATWMGFVKAMMAGTAPNVRTVGVAYMLAPGGSHSSNTDPAATGPTPDNEWGYDAPHLMLVYPSTDMLEGLPRNREAGGPWVMWEGTPYVHVMAPVE